MKNQREIINNSEELSDDPKIKEALSDIDKYQSLLTLKNVEGGKLLLDVLRKDAVTDVDSLLSKYKESSHIEIIGIISSLDAKLQILRLINRSKSNLEGAQEFIDELTR
jgi:hypothetical protein